MVYAAGASPWQHALPWGDVTVQGNKLFLAVSRWPALGALYLPGLDNEIVAARLLQGAQGDDIRCERQEGWMRFDLPPRAPEALVSVVEVELDGAPRVDPTWGLDPEVETEIQAEFAAVSGAVKESVRWMEKFGEWKHVTRVHKWQQGGQATWTVDVLIPGDYQIDLTYAGAGRLVWAAGIVGGERIPNQQNSSHNYQTFPIGLLAFSVPGRYEISISCLEGEIETGSLQAVHFTRTRW